MSIQLSFGQVQHGWTRLHVRVGERAHDIEAFSDVFDPMDDFVRTGRCAIERQPKMAARFWHEPGESRWVVDPHAEGVTEESLEVRVLGFADLFRNQADEEGAELFRFRCGRLDYARAVYGSLADFTAGRRNEHLAGWGEAFPETPFAWLSDTLKND